MESRNSLFEGVGEMPSLSVGATEQFIPLENIADSDRPEYIKEHPNQFEARAVEEEVQEKVEVPEAMNQEIQLPDISSGDAQDFGRPRRSATEVVMAGDSIPVVEADIGNEFKLPAILIDISAYSEVLGISLEGLKTFMHIPYEHELDIPEYDKCNIYLKTNTGKLFQSSYGDFLYMKENLLFYLSKAFGPEATAKEIIRKKDGSGYSLRKLAGGLKSVSFATDYWF